MGFVGYVRTGLHRLVLGSIETVKPGKKVLLLMLSFDWGK